MQVEGGQSPAAENEDDGASSYGTADSEEDGIIPTTTTHDTEKLAERLDDMKASLEAMIGMQNVFAMKIASLEKVVLAMQVDTTWVREDLGIVHEITEKLAEYVADLSKPATAADGERGQRSPSVSPWQPWPYEGGGDDSDRADTTTAIEEDRVHLGEEEPSHIHRVGEAMTAIEETQMLDMNAGMQTNISGVLEEVGGGGWYEKRASLQAIISPTGKQARTRDVEDAAEDGLHQTEMTLDGTQARPQTMARSMWEDFRTAVRDVPPGTDVGHERDADWVRSKRGRGSSRGNREGDRPRGADCGMGGHGNFNLNLSPDGDVGGGESYEKNERGKATRGRCRGSGRGTGRVKRPPAVQPRYSSTACSQAKCLFCLRAAAIDIVNVCGMVWSIHLKQYFYY